MKRTMFLFSLVLVMFLCAVPLAEAKLQTSPLPDGSYQIREIPEPPTVKADIPPLPPEIGLLSPDAVERVYQNSLNGYTFQHTQSEQTITSLWPPTTQKISRTYALSLTIKKKIGQWVVRLQTTNIEAPNTNLLLIQILAGALLIITAISLYDRRFGERRTLVLLLFYLLLALPYVFLPILGKEANLIITLSAISLPCCLAPVAVKFLLKKSGIAGVSLPLACFIMTLISFFSLTLNGLHKIEAAPVRQELLIIFLATVAASFLAGELWHCWHKRGRDEKITLPQVASR